MKEVNVSVKWEGAEEDNLRFIITSNNEYYDSSNVSKKDGWNKKLNLPKYNLSWFLNTLKIEMYADILDENGLYNGNKGKYKVNISGDEHSGFTIKMTLVPNENTLNQAIGSLSHSITNITDKIDNFENNGLTSLNQRNEKSTLRPNLEFALNSDAISPSAVALIGVKAPESISVQVEKEWSEKAIKSEIEV